MIDKEQLNIHSESYIRIVEKSDGLLYTKFVNRRLAWYFTKHLYTFSPNIISLSAFILLLLGAFLFYQPSNYIISITLYFVLAINYVLDSTDGQVARLTRKGSPIGEWLDHSLDGIKIVIVNYLLIDIVISNGDYKHSLIWLFLPLIGQIGLYVTGLLSEKILKSGTDKKSVKAKSNKISFKNILLSPLDYGIFIIIFVITPNVELLTSVYIAYGFYYIIALLAMMLKTFITHK